MTYRFKVDIGNFTNFHSSTWVSKTYTLMGCFRPKYVMFELKRYRGVTFHDTREWCKIRRKIDLWFGKWNEKLGKILPEHTKVSKLGLFLLSKVENVWASNLQGSYVFWQWRMIQNLRRNWLVSSKLTWGI